MSNSTMTSKVLNVVATTLLQSTTLATPTPENTYPPGYGEPSSAKNNRIHDFFVKPLNYALLTPVILVVIAAIVITILQMRIRADPEIEAKLKKAEEARAGMLKKIEAEEIQGKKERAAARLAAKQAATLGK